MSKITDIVNDIIVKTNANTSGLNIHNATSKATPADNDELAILDSENSFSLKKLALANLKNVLFGSPALTGTPTAPTATAGTNTTQIATTAFVKAKSEADSIGVGQTWQNVTASRISGITYTNSTGKPIEVIVSGYTTASSQGILDIYVNFLSISLGQGSSQTTPDSYRRSVSFIVPVGAMYRVDYNLNTVKWCELR